MRRMAILDPGPVQREDRGAGDRQGVPREEREGEREQSQRAHHAEARRGKVAVHITYYCCINPNCIGGGGAY